MSVRGIIMFLEMNNTRLETKRMIILDFENGFLPTSFPLCNDYLLCFLLVMKGISILENISKKDIFETSFQLSEFLEQRQYKNDSTDFR